MVPPLFALRKQLLLDRFSDVWNIGAQIWESFDQKKKKNYIENLVFLIKWKCESWYLTQVVFSGQCSGMLH